MSRDSSGEDHASLAMISYILAKYSADRSELRLRPRLRVSRGRVGRQIFPADIFKLAATSPSTKQNADPLIRTLVFAA